MPLAVWFGRRLAAIAVQLLVLSVAAFSVLYITPGNVAQILLGSTPRTPETIDAINERYNLDRPLVEQYLLWLKNVMSGDFGRSIQTGERVTDVLAAHAVPTIQLTLFALVLVMLFAIPMGLISGVKHGTAVDRTITSISTLGISAPAFATGMILLAVFAVMLPWFPTFGAGEGPWDRLYHLVLPAVTLAFTVIALVSRQTRAVAVGVAKSDYVLFARARGVRRSLVWRRYLLRNSSLPLVTSLGLVTGFFLSGAVIVEQTFSLTGLGSLLLTSVSSKDLPVVQGVTLLGGALILLVNFTADALYMVIDPRVRRQVLA